MPSDAAPAPQTRDEPPQDALTAVHDTSPLRMPAAFARALGDLAAAVGQIETVLAADEVSPAADVRFAAECIRDIATALRRRHVEAALCDALEAAMREIGGAIARDDAVAARTTGAAALLKELAQRVQVMIAMIGVSADGAAGAQFVCGQDSSLAEALAAGVAAEAEKESHAARPDDAAQAAAASVLSVATSSKDDVLVAEPLPQTLPDSQAEVRPGENSDEQYQPLSLPIPEPLDGEKKNRPPAALSAKPGENVGALSRATSHESLSALQTLSEEELIALFG